MVFCSVLTAAKLQLSVTSSWSMVSILDLLHHLSFEFTKNVVLLSKWIAWSTRMEGSHHVNWDDLQEKCNTLDWNKGIVLAAKGSNTNLVQFLPPHHVIISKVHDYSFISTISQMHKCASKTVLHARNVAYKKLEGLFINQVEVF